MSIRGLVIQDSFLKQLRKEQVQVTVHLMNGFQFRGVVKAFDSFIILLDVDQKQIMIYKHAISTISPAKHINFTAESQNDSNNI